MKIDFQQKDLYGILAWRNWHFFKEKMGELANNGGNSLQLSLEKW